jgi:DNA-directed RNA polymerase specialized sigma subunit
MFFKTPKEFFDYTKTVQRISRSEELELAKRMQEGDEKAQEALITSYLPVLASYLNRYWRNPSLEFVYRGLAVLRTSVLHFDFQMENPSFTRFLAARIKRMAALFIVDHPL